MVDMNTNDATIYKPEEQELLNKTLDFRLRMVNEVFKDGTPKYGSDIRVVNEVLNSIDNAVNQSSLGRIKHKELEIKQAAIKNNEEIRGTIVGILKEQAAMRAKQVNRTSDQEIVLSDTIEKPTFVPGETSFEQPELTIEEIMGEEPNDEI